MIIKMTSYLNQICETISKLTMEPKESSDISLYALNCFRDLKDLASRSDSSGIKSRELLVQLLNTVKSYMKYDNGSRLFKLEQIQDPPFDEWISLFFNIAQNKLPSDVKQNVSDRENGLVSFKTQKIALSIILDIFSLHDDLIQSRLHFLGYYSVVIGLCVESTRLFYNQSVEQTDISILMLALKILRTFSNSVLTCDKLLIMKHVLEPLNVTLIKFANWSLYPNTKHDNKSAPYRVIQVRGVQEELDKLISDIFDQMFQNDYKILSMMMIDRLNSLNVFGIPNHILKDDCHSRHFVGLTLLPDRTEANDFESLYTSCQIMASDSKGILAEQMKKSSIKKLLQLTLSNSELALRLKALEAIATIRGYYLRVGRVNDSRKLLENMKNNVEIILKDLMFQLNISKEHKSFDVSNILINIHMIADLYGHEAQSILVENLEILRENFMINCNSNSNSSLELNIIKSKLLTLDILYRILMNAKDHERLELESRFVPFLLASLEISNNSICIELKKKALYILAEMLVEESGKSIVTILSQIKNIEKHMDFKLSEPLMLVLHKSITRCSFQLIHSPECLQSIYDLCAGVLESDKHTNECRSNSAKILEIMIQEFRYQPKFRQKYLPKIVKLSKMLLSSRMIKQDTDKDNKSKLPSAVSRDTQFVSQLLLLISIAIDTDYDITIKEFYRQPSDFSFNSDQRTFELYADYVLGIKPIAIIDNYWPRHESRALIRAICTIIRQPTSLRPRCLDSKASHVIPRILNIFEFLHTQYEDYLAALGWTERCKHPEGDYLDWVPTFNRTFDSKLDQDTGFSLEINLFRASLSEIKRVDSNWYHMLTGNLDMLQKKYLDDLYEYAESKGQGEEASWRTHFKHMRHSIMRSSTRLRRMSTF